MLGEAASANDDDTQMPTLQKRPFHSLAHTRVFIQLAKNPEHTGNRGAGRSNSKPLFLYQQMAVLYGRRTAVT